jgi:prophage antirepressor-like protein
VGIFQPMAYANSWSEGMKDPIHWIVGAAIVCVLGVAAYAEIVTRHEHTTAVQNNQTNVARNH